MLLAFAMPLLDSTAVPAGDKLTVEFRWIENRFVEGVTEEQPQSISPCDEGSWYLHRKPALTTVDFAKANLETVISGGGGKKYHISYKLKDSAIEKLVQQCGEENRKRIAVVCVKYKGKDAEILPSPIKYFPATTFDKRQPKAFRHPYVYLTPSKEFAERILQASR
jgi:hypothetical protein